MTADSTTSLPDDGSLLLAWSRRRDEGAFLHFVQRHLGMVQGAALRKTSRPELAEEVAQAVFALAARRAGALAGHPCPGAWLHRTAVLESANALRRELKHRKIAAAVHSHPDTSPEPGLPDAALPHLDDALNSLNESDRRAVLLRFGEKLSYNQMADRLGKSADACQKQTSRALDRLRAALSRRRITGITLTALAAALVPALTSPASAAAGKICTGAIAAAPKISLAAILHHLLNTMNTGKQITAAAGLTALLAAVPLTQSYSEAASLRRKLTEQSFPALPVGASAKQPGRRNQAEETAGSRILPGCSPAEADRTVAMLRALRGRMLTSMQLLDISRQLMSLPESHMDRALAAMADFPGLLPAGLLRVMVFSRWAELNPGAATAAVASHKLDTITGEMARQAVAFGWMERDPIGLAAWLRDNPQAQMSGTLATAIGLSPQLFDRETMQQLRPVIPSGYYPGKLELAWESEAEDGNVSAVAAKLLATAPDDHRRDQLIADAARYLIRTDPKAALDFVLAHPDPRGKFSGRALENSVQAWAGQDLSSATRWAWEWLRKGGETAPTGPVWSALGAKSEAEILRFAAGAPDEAARLMVIEMTAMQPALEPEKSLGLIASLPDEPRLRAMENHSSVRAAESTVKTSEWLLTLADGPDKDAAIHGFAPVLAKSDAESAMIWAASLTSGAQRSELLHKLGNEWISKSPDAARQWINSSTALSEADRASFTANP